MRLSDHQAAFTQDLARLIRMVDYIRPSHRVRLSYAERSLEEQQRLMDEGASSISNPELSNHTKRLAADLILDNRTNDGWEYLTQTSDYAELGRQWELMSIFNRWGGRYNDGNHFERLTEIRQEIQPITT